MRFPGDSGWERLSRFTNLEHSCQTLIEAFDGSIKIRSPGGSVGHFVGVQVRGDRLAELGCAAYALLGEQGAHWRRIPLLGLALLQFLKSPGGLAHVIDGVAKLTKHTRIHPPRPDGFLPLPQF